MTNSFYLTLSKEMALMRKMEIVSNNIANINTPGFNADHVVFNEYLARLDGQQEISYVRDVGLLRDTTNGPISQTYRDLDVALEGKGYFALNTPNGERYTRAGSFTLNNEGALVTQEGYEILDIGGANITIPQEAKLIEFKKDGTIFVDGQILQKLKIVDFEFPNMLMKAGANSYKSELDPIDAENINLVQGALEGSNVSAIQQVTEMIQTEREFIMEVKLLDNLDQMLRSTIRKLGKPV